MTLVGLSTGVFFTSPPADALAKVLQCGVDAVELSCYHEYDLDKVEALITSRLRSSLIRLALHAPVASRHLPEDALVERLGGFDLDVIVHPSVIQDFELWKQLDDRLLLENEAGGTVAASADDMSGLFDRLPRAGFCLDVSHAVLTGGGAAVAEMYDSFADRLKQVHIGCGMLESASTELDPALLEHLRVLFSSTASTCPVIIEREMVDEPTEFVVQQVALVAKYASGVELESARTTRKDAM